MTTAILGRKIGMTQIFDDKGNRVPVTVIQAGPCVVVQKRTLTKDNYSAIQIGFQSVPKRKLNKPELGVFERTGLDPVKFLREIRLSEQEASSFNVGDKITVGAFREIAKVDVVGISKGRGFQGVIKRYNFQGFPATHGTHEYRRHPGSIGNREEPGRVVKGKKLPGQMGNIRVTTQSLKFIKVDEERNILLVRGAIPGAAGEVVLIRKAVKTK